MNTELHFTQEALLEDSLIKLGEGADHREVLTALIKKIAKAAAEAQDLMDRLKLDPIPGFGEEARYRTDDRDYPDDEQYELKIMPGGNGDWYVSVLPIGDALGPSVRLCTSGGASRAAPGLTAGISSAYRAIKAAEAKFIIRSS